MSFGTISTLEESMRIKEENTELKRKIKIFESNLISQEAVFEDLLEKAVARQTVIVEEVVAERMKKLENIIAIKDTEIMGLKNQILKLHSRLDNNANNSGIATASTPIHKEKRIPNLRQKSYKTIGGQQGHIKHTLSSFSEDEITEHIHHEHVICDTCESSMKRTGEERQKDEYDVKVVVRKKRHHFHETSCQKCKTTKTMPIPNHLKEANQYGSGIDALALSLINVGFVSMARTKELINGFSSGEVDLSVGYIAKVQQKIAKQLMPFASEVKQSLILSKVVHWDDTVIMINKKRSCLRIYTSNQLGLYTAHARKDKIGLDEDNVLSFLSSDTVVVHDHNMVNYNDEYIFKNAECCVHLLRDLKKVEENLPSHKWAGRMKELLTETNKERNYGLEMDVDKVQSEFQEILKLATSENETEDTETYYRDKEATLIKRLKKYGDNYLMWVTNEEIPFSNNESERSLRGVKTKMKVSGQFQNVERARDFAIIKTYIETGKRHGLNPFELLKMAIEGKFMALAQMQEYFKNHG